MSRRSSDDLTGPEESGANVLEDLTAEAERWVLETAAALRADDRAVAGGWPGTMSEARQRLAVLVAAKRHAPIAADDQGRTARRLYETARRAWAARASAETDTDE